MSLLIKALEQAAKDRKTSSVEPTQAAPAARESVPVEPTVEPPPPSRIAGKTETRREPASSPRAAVPADAIDPPRRPVSSLADLANIDAQQQRARAAAVMQAGGGAAQTAIAYLRANPVMMLAAVGVVFGILFGIYVYVQIAKPGLFTRQAAAPPPPPAPPAPQASAGPPETGGPGPTANVPTPPAYDPIPPSPVSPAPSSGAPVAGSLPGSGGAPGAAVAPAGPPPIPSGSIIGSTPSAEVQRDSLRMRGEAAEAGRARGSISPPAESPPAAPRAPKPAPAAVAASEPGASRENIKVSPTTAQPRLNPTLAQAYTLLQSGNTEEARSLYQRIVQTEPLNIDALLGLAYIAAQDNRSDDALNLYLRILQVNPRHATAQAAMIGLMGRADPVASESRLKQLISREPAAFLHFILGNLYADQGQWAPAQQSYFQAHHLEPSNPDYAYNLAIGLDHLRQGKLALDYYRRADQLASAQGRANFNTSHARERIRALSSQLE